MMVDRVSYRIFGLGGEIYWCINEARKCERRGWGHPPPCLSNLAREAKSSKKCLGGGGALCNSRPPSLILHGQYLFKIPVRAMSETLIYEQQIKLRRGFSSNSKVTYDCLPPPRFYIPRIQPCTCSCSHFWGVFHSHA